MNDSYSSQLNALIEQVQDDHTSDEDVGNDPLDQNAAIIHRCVMAKFSLFDGEYLSQLDLLKRCPESVATRLVEDAFEHFDGLEVKHRMERYEMYGDGPNTRSDGRPIFWMCRQHLDQLDAVLDRGADVNARDQKGNTLLHDLSPHRPRDTDVVDLLVKKGADVFARNQDGEMPSHPRVQELRAEKQREHLEKHLAQVPTPALVSASVGQGEGIETPKRRRL